MKNMEMTIKQLADELGVSKPTIRNIVSKLGIQSKLRKVGNRYTLSDTQITQVKLQISKNEVLSESEKTKKSESQALSESEKSEKSEKSKSQMLSESEKTKKLESQMLSESEKLKNSIVREQLSILSKQLTVKDTQIQMLQDQLITKDSQIQLLQEQIGQLTAAMESMANALTGAQALHAGTIQKQLTGHNDRVEQSSDPEQPKQKQGFFSKFFRKKNN
ncbi:MAG: hypothetical protein II388_09820 [Clostridia bacterium]|nr:hypothetical protein [Clostridia bacterium]